MLYLNNIWDNKDKSRYQLFNIYCTMIIQYDFYAVSFRIFFVKNLYKINKIIRCMFISYKWNSFFRQQIHCH